MSHRAFADHGSRPASLTPASETDCPRDQGREEGKVQVFYDGACPLCAKEIAYYRARPGAEAIAWVDAASAPPEALPEGLSQQQALRRFHVQTPNGDMVSGAAAFATLWAALPGWRWIGRLALFRPVTWLLEAAYRLFLPLRPWLRSFVEDPNTARARKRF